MNKCIFCDVTPGVDFKVLWEDNEYIAFFDHKPACALHILVITREHIESAKDLSKKDVDRVKAMEAIGNQILDDQQVSKDSRRMGFHIPPFNSVNHLHLHVQGLPYRDVTRRAKYVISHWPGYDKGFGWFVEVKQAIKILEKGRKIRVMCC